MFKLLVLALCFTGGLSVLLDDVYDPFPFMWQRGKLILSLKFKKCKKKMFLVLLYLRNISQVLGAIS